MKSKNVIRKLRQAGVEVTNRRGMRHATLKYQGKFCTFPRGADDFGPVFLKMICNQLGLNYNEIFKFQKAPVDEETQKIPVRIYISGDEIPESKKFKIIQSLSKLLSKDGFEFTAEIEDKESSWWSNLVYGAKKQISKKQVQNRLVKTEKAIQAHFLDKPQADADKSEAEAVSSLIKALEGDVSACIHVGSLLLIKTVNSSGKASIFARSLTPFELKSIEENISILNKPDIIIEWLNEFSIKTRNGSGTLKINHKNKEKM